MGICASSTAVPVDQANVPHSYNHNNNTDNFQGVNNFATAPSARRNGTNSMVLSSSHLTNNNGPTSGSSMILHAGGTSTSSLHHNHHNKEDNHSTSVADKLANLSFPGLKRNSSGNNIRSSSNTNLSSSGTNSNPSSTVSLISLQSGHTVDLRSLPELPPALFLAAIFNDVAFFKVSISSLYHFYLSVDVLL